MKETILSIMVTAYNQEEYIAEALDSILNQITQYKYEIIIGEDSSTDSTADICKVYALKYPDKIKVIYNKSNLGILGNWDSTLSHCQSKYVAICEGDNYWTDASKIENQITFLENHHDCGIVCSNYSRYYQTSGKREFNCLTNRKFRKQIGYSDYILDRSSIMSATVIFRNELYERYINSVPENIRHQWPRTPDTPLFLFMAHETNIYVMPESTAEYRLLDVSGCRLGDQDLQNEFIIKGYDIPIYFVSELFKCPKLLKRVKIARQNFVLDVAFAKRDKDLLKRTREMYSVGDSRPSLRYLLYLRALKWGLFYERILKIINFWRRFRIRVLKL